MATGTKARPKDATPPLPESVDTASVVPDPGEILRNYPRTYLVCRADRHRWNREYVWRSIAVGVVERETTCADCGTSKRQTINRRGWYRVGPVRYDYPDGYTTRRTGLTSSDFQGEYLKRDFAEAQRGGRIEAQL